MRPPSTGSLAASTTSTTAAAMPASASAPGRSPVTIPTVAGTRALVATIGATTLMGPRASAR